MLLDNINDHDAVVKPPTLSCSQPNPPPSTWFSLWSYLLPAPFWATRRAFVLLDVLSLGRRYLHTFPMEPPFADVTADPKLVGTVVAAAASTECFTMFIFLFAIVIFVWLWGASSWSIDGSLQHKIKVVLREEGRERQSWDTSSLLWDIWASTMLINIATIIGTTVPIC